MLTTEQITKLANLAKLKPEDLTAAINAKDPATIEIPEDLHVFTPDELTARDTSQQTIGKKAGETEGEKKGKELAAKIFKDKLGITDASKDPDVVAAKAQEKMGNDSALQEQVTLLQGKVAAAEKERDKALTAAQRKEKEVALIASLPANISKALNTTEHLTIVNANLDFREDGVYLRSTNQMLRDEKTTNPLSEGDAIKHFYEKVKPGLLEATTPGGGGAGGRGGSDSSGGTGGTGATTLGQFWKTWSASHPGEHIAGAGFRAAVKEELKNNPDMVMDADEDLA